MVMSANRRTKAVAESHVDELPRVLAAPGLLEQPSKVVREEDDTDASYEARCELFALLIAAAGKS
jgi:hypothetical protein